MSTDLKLKPYTYDQLFFTPLIRYQVQNHEALDAQLLKEGKRLREVSEGVNISNKNGWHSSGNLFSQDAKCFKVLSQLVVKAIHGATTHIAKDYDPTKSEIQLQAWMNHNPTGGFNAPHTHPGAHWSGVYYVSQPQDGDKGTGGKLEFIDPRSDVSFWHSLKSSAFRPNVQVRPKAGEIVLFPSYLLHWVYPNESPLPRVTIAFNATLSN